MTLVAEEKAKEEARNRGRLALPPSYKEVDEWILYLCTGARSDKGEENRFNKETTRQQHLEMQSHKQLGPFRKLVDA